jgi:hypothetical protein
VLDTAEREAAIWQGAQNLAFAAGMEVVEDPACWPRWPGWSNGRCR